MNAPDLARNRSTSDVGATVLAPIGVLAASLGVGPASGAFADRSLPLPGSPDSVGRVLSMVWTVGAGVVVWRLLRGEYR